MRRDRLMRAGAVVHLLLVVGVVAVTVPVAGCGKGGPPMAQVSGKITYSDGSIPKGSQTIVTLVPAAGTTAEIKKGASSDIKPDGSFDLYTMKPGDGVFYGKYKVVFFVLGSYRGGGGNEVDQKYATADTTPVEVEINQPSHTFDFEIEKAK